MSGLGTPNHHAAAGNALRTIADRNETISWLKEWCAALEQGLKSEVACYSGDHAVQRTLIDELKALDPDNWWLATVNRDRIAEPIMDAAYNAMRDGIDVVSPSRALLFKRTDAGERLAYIKRMPRKEGRPDEQRGTIVDETKDPNEYVAPVARKDDLDPPLPGSPLADIQSKIDEAETVVAAADAEIAQWEELIPLAEQSLAQKEQSQDEGAPGFLGRLFNAEDPRPKQRAAVDAARVNLENARQGLAQAIDKRNKLAIEMHTTIFKMKERQTELYKHREERRQLTAYWKEQMKLERAKIDAKYGVSGEE